MKKFKFNIPALLCSFVLSVSALAYIGTLNPTKEVPVTLNAPMSDTVGASTQNRTLDTIYVPQSAVRASSIQKKVDLAQACSNDFGYIDWSTAEDGYITVGYTADTDKTVKCTVVSPEKQYVYTIPDGKAITVSLTEGSGNYRISILEQVEGTRYRVKTTGEFTADLSDEFGPFLASNPYANWAEAPDVIEKAQELTRNATTTLEKVTAIYDFVVRTLSYDTKKADTVPSGYLPDLDQVLEDKTGICFDYASLTVGMLRSQGIPCKLVIGYAGNAYHAWVSVWCDETGWASNAAYFSGGEWERMDPTFASTGGNSAFVLNYIGDGTNYQPSLYY